MRKSGLTVPILDDSLEVIPRWFPTLSGWFPFATECSTYR